MHRFAMERCVEAPADLVWAVISDVVGYAEVAPNLSRAEILEGEGSAAGLQECPFSCSRPRAERQGNVAPPRIMYLGLHPLTPVNLR